MLYCCQQKVNWSPAKNVMNNKVEDQSQCVVSSIKTAGHAGVDGGNVIYSTKLYSHW